METVSDFITALGGTGKAAKLFGVGPSAVSNWKASNKLPLRLYREVARMCQAKMVNVPDKLFDSDRSSAA